VFRHLDAAVMTMNSAVSTISLWKQRGQNSIKWLS